MASRRCSVGAVRQTQCSARPYLKRTSLDARHAHLLDRRADVTVQLVCSAHFEEFITHYDRGQKSCCNPFGDHPRLKASTGLRTVSAELHDKCLQTLPVVVQGKKLCVTCRKNVRTALKSTTIFLDVTDNEAAAVKPSRPINNAHTSASPAAPGFVTSDRESAAAVPAAPGSITSESGSGVSDASSGEKFSPKPDAFVRLNEGIQIIGGSPVVKKKLMQSSKYGQQKYGKMKSLLKSTLNRAAGIQEPAETVDYEMAGEEMINQLKAKYSTAKTYAEKIQILSLLPASWSASRIVKEFQATYHMVKIMRGLVAEQGILCSPNPKRGKSLSVETEQLVRQFFESTEVSREMAGKKECISVRQNGFREMVQKRLVLGDLREVYNLFKEKHPTVKIGFSKFASLRPRHCVLAGAAGTHAVCVCMIHQNFKLMFGSVGSLKLDDTKPFDHYKEIILMTMCDDPQESCHFGKCEHCPGLDGVRETLTNLLRQNFVSEVSFKRWAKKENGRFALENVTEEAADFVEAFVTSIPEVRQHDFIAKQQALNFEKKKESLKANEVLVVLDFSENYAFVIQDAVQGAYWNNQQATVHPCACYWRNPATDKVEPLNLVFISDHLKHVTATVSKFQEVLIKFLKEKIPDLAKIYYFSDGCAGQYKNRFNMINLAKHKEDYGVDAEWHFFATSHGKGPSDGLGGTLKRLATRASLQRPITGQIQTPTDLFEWAQQKIKGITCEFVKSSDIKKHTRKLAKRFLAAPSLAGIRSHHAFLPRENNTIEMKILSSSLFGDIRKVAGDDASNADDDGLENEELEGIAEAASLPRLRPRHHPATELRATPVTSSLASGSPTATPQWTRSRFRTPLKVIKKKHVTPAKSPSPAWGTTRLRCRAKKQQ